MPSSFSPPPPPPRAICALTLLLVALTGQLSSAANGADRFAADTDAVDSGIKFTLGAGDRLRLTVFGHEDLSGEFNVGETGGMSLPLVGNVNMGGLTIQQAERLVEDALRPDYLLNPRVSIEVLNYRPFYILGEVNRPGSYPYAIGLTVTEAVALGGGFTTRARKDRVGIIRSADPEKTEQDADAGSPVLPGDVVNVRERFF